MFGAFNQVHRMQEIHGLKKKIVDLYNQWKVFFRRIEREYTLGIAIMMMAGTDNR